MSTQLSLENFEIIYHNTYHKTLRYIVSKCSNIEDVNDLIQETYTQLYSALYRKSSIEVENCEAYIIGIAKKRIKRHYGTLYQLKLDYFWHQTEEGEIQEEIPSDFNLENDMIMNWNAEMVWKYIKKKEVKIVKIFYLYYCLELKLSEIAKELNMSESNVKNLLYRTIKEIQKKVKMEGDENDK